MNQRRICVVITARPSYSRVKSALTAIERHPELDLQVVVAASALLPRYGNVIDQIEADGFNVDARVYMVLEGENPTSMAKTAGIGMVELATTFDSLQPHAVVSVADRFETIATAIAAAYMNIPMVHILGGEVSGSIDEKVRHAVTKLADLHLTATKLARERVIRMGEAPEAVHVTGCPSIDIAASIVRDPKLDFDPFDRYGGVGPRVDLSSGYAVVLQHPVTTEYTTSKSHVEETLRALDALGIPTLWFWPNVDAGSDGTSTGIRAYRETYSPKNMHFFKNMSPTDFLRLLANSHCIVGNSSVAIRECSFIGVPAVNIGTRQNGRERGRNVIDVGYDSEDIANAIEAQFGRGRTERDTIYGDGDAGMRIAEAIAMSTLGIDKRLTY